MTSFRSWCRAKVSHMICMRRSLRDCGGTVHTDTRCCTLQWLQCLLFCLLRKVTWSLSQFVLPSICQVTVTFSLLTIHFSFLLVCALCFLYLFVFKHVYFWLPYASAAVANSVTVFARYFCGDHLRSFTRDRIFPHGQRQRWLHYIERPSHIVQ